MDDYHIPVEKSDPLSEDSTLEKNVWWAMISIAYAMFGVLFIGSLIL